MVRVILVKRSVYLLVGKAAGNHKCSKQSPSNLSVFLFPKKTPNCDHKGLKLEVTQHPHSLRHVANIIVALQWMKHSHTPRGTEFSDDELINIMLDNVIDGRSPIVEFTC